MNPSWTRQNSGTSSGIVPNASSATGTVDGGSDWD